MALNGIVKVLHILAMAALIAGLCGRPGARLDRARWRRASRWPLLRAGVPTWTLVGAALFLATIPLVIWVYVPRGKRFSAAFRAALTQQRVTAGLRAALTDPAIRLSYLYEYLMVAFVTTLMVTKPF